MFCCFVNLEYSLIKLPSKYSKRLIYRQYEREISYCIPRNQIRDTLAIYLLENHVALDVDQEAGPIKTHGELASAILRKFCSKNVGWLEEENNEATYENHERNLAFW